MRKTAMFVFTVTFLGASLRAQPPKTIGYGGARSFEAPAQPEPAALVEIYSNLGSATSTYTQLGLALFGPLSVYGTSEFAAMSFTPKANAHVSEVSAAIQYNGTGANQVNLSLYSDTRGVPGVLLAGPVTVTNLPNFQSCCKLAVAGFESSVAVTSGTRSGSWRTHP